MAYEEDYVGEDMVDDVLAAVSGIQSVGAGRPRRLPGMAAPSPPFGRTKADVFRRAPLGFPAFTLAATIGATTTITATVSRMFHPNRLLIVPSATGAVLDSLKIGDEEQLAAAGAPVELYGTLALTDSLPDNFTPLPAGITCSLVLRNTTAVAITGTVGMKGGVER